MPLASIEPDHWLETVTADRPLPAWLRQLVLQARCRAGDRLPVVLVRCGGLGDAAHKYIVCEVSDFEAHFGRVGTE